MPAKLRAVKVLADEPMKPEHVECHTMGHQWKHRGKIGIDDPGAHRRPYAGSNISMVGYRSLCTNCATERIAWVTRSGEKINRYKYPDGYCRRGPERVTHAEYRRTFAAVLFEEF